MRIGTSSVNQTTLSMTTLDPKHINKNAPKTQSNDVEKSFADVFFNAVNNINNEQINADKLQQDAVIAPDSVNVADILIATEKARLSVGMLKAVTERASRAYTEIMNIR
ncbi:MAG: flagellar hook-basal body complex protein FliE [Brevinema sp.]